MAESNSHKCTWLYMYIWRCCKQITEASIRNIEICIYSFEWWKIVYVKFVFPGYFLSWIVFVWVCVWQSSEINFLYTEFRDICYRLNECDWMMRACYRYQNEIQCTKQTYFRMLLASLWSFREIEMGWSRNQIEISAQNVLTKLTGSCDVIDKGSEVSDSRK